jgi:TolA-binding protein
MTQKTAQADAEVDKLISDFKGNAELPAILYGMVLRYKTARELQRAQNLSQRICQEFPSSEQAQRIQLDTGKELVFKHIANGKYQQAEEAVNNMVSAAGKSSAMPATLYRIAKEFKEQEVYEQADRIYQKIAQDYPNSEFGNKAKMAVDKLKIWNLIKSGDVAAVQVATEKLIQDYSGEEDLAHTVHGFGIQFEKQGNFEQAKAIYLKVKNDFPNDWVAEIANIDSEMVDVRAMVGKAPFSDVMSQLNAVRNKFIDHWHLPKAIRQAGQEYQRQAMQLEIAGSMEQAKDFYRNAIAVWDIVVNQLPKSSSSAPACCWSGNCYIRLGEYAKAIDCYQKVVDNYPTFCLRQNALFMVGQTYEEMKDTGVISQSEADTKIKAVYLQLVEKYPDCSVAETAQNWLNRHNSN